MDLDEIVAHAMRQSMADQRRRDADALVREVLKDYQAHVLREARRVRVIAENRLAAVTN